MNISSSSWSVLLHFLILQSYLNITRPSDPRARALPHPRPHHRPPIPPPFLLQGGRVGTVGGQISSDVLRPELHDSLSAALPQESLGTFKMKCKLPSLPPLLPRGSLVLIYRVVPGYRNWQIESRLVLASFFPWRRRRQLSLAVPQSSVKRHLFWVSLGLPWLALDLFWLAGLPVSSSILETRWLGQKPWFLFPGTLL